MKGTFSVGLGGAAVCGAATLGAVFLVVKHQLDGGLWRGKEAAVTGGALELLTEDGRRKVATRAVLAGLAAALAVGVLL